MTKMTISRRRFGANAAALGATLALGQSCARPKGAPWTERRDLYPQGVSSGDPAKDSVILWTRRPPTAESSAAKLTLEVASDPEFRKIAASGVAEISADADWTCRFLAAGLKPAREYWYRFTDESGFGSRIGRTLTAPADDDPRVVNFAFVSCQSIPEGALNGYRRMIYEDERRAPEERLGFVLHLGDYIYEVVWYPEDLPKRYGRTIRDITRFPTGEKIIAKLHVPVTLEDYRELYKSYLLDPDLQDARARWPFICIWDNHEFSWRGWQSQQVFGDETRPAQTKKVAANQAWFEYQPARVEKPGDPSLDRFTPPAVVDTPITDVDEFGVGTEPNNLTAINSLKVYRSLRWGGNVDLILTDHHSYCTESPKVGEEFVAEEFGAFPQDAAEAIDAGRGYRGGNPPATIRFDGKDLPNPGKDALPQSSMGGEQKAWFLDELKKSRAVWRIWGHSTGTFTSRADLQNLPEGVGPKWPSDSYGFFGGGNFVENSDIFDFVRRENITNFAIVAGDKHSFWAGYASKDLPPQPFEPVGVQFIGGSMTSPGMFEAYEYNYPKDDALRPLYLYDKPDGGVLPAMNMTFLHGVRSSLKFHETGDVEAALAVRNPDVSPHLKFLDLGGHGYATVRVTPEELETEFVCIPRPIDRATTEDGGPLAYRAVHRVKKWAPGETPRLEQEIVEGTTPLAT